MDQDEKHEDRPLTMEEKKEAFVDNLFMNTDYLDDASLLDGSPWKDAEKMKDHRKKVAWMLISEDFEAIGRMICEEVLKGAFEYAEEEV